MQLIGVAETPDGSDIAIGAYQYISAGRQAITLPDLTAGINEHRLIVHTVAVDRFGIELHPVTNGGSPKAPRP